MAHTYSPREPKYENVPPDRIEEEWLTRTQARAKLRCTPLEFGRLIASGELKEWRLSGQQRVYESAEVDSLLDTELDEPRAGAVVAPQSDSIKAATELVKQAQSQVERLVNTLIQGQEKSQQTYEKTIEALAAEVTQLRKTHNEALRVAQDSRWSDLEREVVITKLTNEDSRAQQVAQTVLPHLGPIVQAVSLGIANAMPWMKGLQQQLTQVTTTEAPAAAATAQAPASVSTPQQAPETIPTEPVPVAPLSKAEALVKAIGRERLDLLARSGLVDEDSDEGTLLREVISTLPVATPKPEESENDHA